MLWLESGNRLLDLGRTGKFMSDQVKSPLSTWAEGDNGDEQSSTLSNWVEGDKRDVQSFHGSMEFA